MDRGISSAACLSITLLLCLLLVLLGPRHAASACISILCCPSARVPITQFYDIRQIVSSDVKHDHTLILLFKTRPSRSHTRLERLSIIRFLRRSKDQLKIPGHPILNRYSCTIFPVNLMIPPLIRNVKPGSNHP